MTRRFQLDSSGRLLGSLAAVLVVFLAMGYFAVEWMYNRIYVPPGHSLLVRYKGPPLPYVLPGNRPTATPGQFAKVDEDGDPLQLGVIREMKGPGRHFYCPLWWERTIVPDHVVEPGQVAVVTSKMGQDLPSGQFLVDGDLDQTEFKGILRRVFGPGRYRVNPYAYDVGVVQLEKINSGAQEKYAGWVSVPTGYVGVVTNLAGNPLTGAKAGIAANVLPPGLYPINPKEQHVDIVEVGFREKSITANLQTDAAGNPKLDPSGEPVISEDGSGIAFPSNDGFTIHMDFTAVWGLMPDQAANVVKTFGTVDAVETKVVIPQIESICRNMGSRLGAVDLLVGESRLQFQDQTAQNFRDVLQEKFLTLQTGLVRHIYIPQEVRVPIQQAFIADELKLTREQEQLTARTEAMLRGAERKVELETERTRAETEKLVAELIAEGQKTAEETKAETEKLVAAIARQTAELDAQAAVVRGEAEANSRKMQEEAKSEKFALAVQAFGSGEAYNQWVFASGLPEDMELKLLYAGEGTFWTDLKGFTETMLGRQAQESRPSPAANAQPANRR